MNRTGIISLVLMWIVVASWVASWGCSARPIAGSSPSALPPIVVSPPANSDYFDESVTTPWQPVDLVLLIDAKPNLSTKVMKTDTLQTESLSVGPLAPRARRRPVTTPSVPPIDPLGRPQLMTFRFGADSLPARTPQHRLPWILCVTWQDHADDNQMSCSKESGAGAEIALQVYIPGRTYGRAFALEGIMRRFEAEILENGEPLDMWKGAIVQEKARPKP